MLKINLDNLYKRYKVVVDNIFFVGLIQIFSLLAPFITYPYLVDVLGMDLYGIVISAQVLVSYATIVIDFGSNSVCAKNVSIHRNDEHKLSEILSAVLFIRFQIWVICFFFYLLVVLCIPTYKEHLLLFVLTYFLTFNDLLFPQFFFQGFEKMKVVSILTILVKLLFILLVFVFVKDKQDYVIVPMMYSIGYVIAGLISLYIILKQFGVRLFIPSYKKQINYVKECSPILATDLVCTIKDKFNYLLVGMYVGMSDVVIYDLGLKLKDLVSRPATIITTVLLPRFAQNRNVKQLQYVLAFVFLLSCMLVLFINIFLEEIVFFFLSQHVDLLPIRLFSLVPIIFCPSIVLASNFFISFGLNKYLFFSILITTAVYLLLLIVFWITGYLENNLYSFISLTLISFLVEFIYRMIVFYRKKDIINK